MTKHKFVQKLFYKTKILILPTQKPHRTFVLSKKYVGRFDRGYLLPRLAKSINIYFFFSKKSNPMTHFYSSKLWRFALSFSILLCLAPRLFSQCNPDITPPIAVCDEFTSVALSLDGTATVFAAAYDDGSYDDCCAVTFLARKQADGPCDADALPDNFAASVTFCCAEIGIPFVVELQVNDCNGNSTVCLITVEVQDKTAPTLQAPANITVSCDAFDASLATYGTATVTDNCCIGNTVVSVNYSQFDTNCTKGIITRTFQAFDCNGNSSTLGVPSSVQTIVVNHVQEYYIKFPDDVTSVESPIGVYGEPEFFEKGCELIGLGYEDHIFINQPDCDYRIERTWLINNYCTYDPDLPLIVIPNPRPNISINHPANFPGPIVSAPGTLSPWNSTIVKVDPLDPTATDYSTFLDANANGYQYTQIIKLIDSVFVAVEGKVFSDSTANCSYDNGETLLEAWTVKATGQATGEVREAITDANGQYLFLLNPTDTVVTITLVSSGNFGQNCQTEYTVNVPVGTTATQDVPVQLEQRCGLLTVGIVTPRLRRCFTNEYKVQAFNLSSETVLGAYVEVTLDNYLVYTSSSIPGTLVSGNTYSFPLGDIAAGDFRNFTIHFDVSCEAPFGATHCTEAHIYPYDDCSEGSSWSGADVEVNAICDGDSVRFTINNVGVGGMTQIQDFVVVEDVVMRQEGTFQLGVGQSLNFSQPANGSTWRLQAGEEPLHPWGGLQAVALEGCGGLNITGLVNLFPLSDPNPFGAIDCTINIGAFDPNDKQGFPIGYGSEHFIEANTDIEYLIRFQNTGTDTAFTVVIKDEIAAQLDPASVRVLGASHPMEFALLENGILRFTFNNILLPDSNVNQIASNGFVKFRIAQKPDLTDGTRIENKAAIFFDFNDPVITNTTFHTIGDHFISVSTDDLENDGLLGAYPNPVSDILFFDLKDQASTGRFELSNSLGQQVSNESFTGKQFRFERKNLPAGIYLFQLTTNNTKIASGKIVLR